jgi:hypothetical protein
MSHTRAATSLGLSAICLLTFCGVASAQFPGQQDSLGGMHGVKVLILTTNDEWKTADLDRDVVETDVELRLRKAGIPVLVGKEWPERYQKAVVVVRVRFVKHDDILAVAITVQLWRMMEGSSAPYVSTWEELGVGLFSESVARASIRERIGDHIDKFANDYLAANPKSQH